MKNSNYYKDLFQKYYNRKLYIEENINKIKLEREKLERDVKNSEEALKIVRIVGIETQSQIAQAIEEITNSVMKTVFDDPYYVKVEFKEKRDRIECQINFERNGEELSPMDSSGVGTIDVASFGLRLAVWCINQYNIDSVIIADEPFRYLSKGYQENASLMLKEMSYKLGIQFVIVTHEDTLTLYSDKLFLVKKSKDKSIVEEKK